MAFNERVYDGLGSPRKNFWDQTLGGDGKTVIPAVLLTLTLRIRSENAFYLRKASKVLVSSGIRVHLTDCDTSLFVWIFVI